MQYCVRCGSMMADGSVACPSCGMAPPPRRAPAPHDVSPTSYGVAVALCGIFGTLGLHHFYLGNFGHGLFDLGLFCASMFFLFFPPDPSLVTVGLILLLIDGVHTIFVFYRLIVGEQRDGAGLLVRFSGQ